jgi:hypothetical protein
VDSSDSPGPGSSMQREMGDARGQRPAGRSSILRSTRPINCSSRSRGSAGRALVRAFLPFACCSTSRTPFVRLGDTLLTLLPRFA